MKLQLEELSNNPNRSFSLMFNPRMSDLFFWHFHPEYELVYIEGATGTRHVGKHVSTYKGSDLVLIGSNMPHLNFDYQVKTSYIKVVLHLQPTFVEQQLSNTPELTAIHELFQIAKHGVVFHGEQKRDLGQAFMQLEGKSPFIQYLSILEMLEKISQLDRELLHTNPYVNRYREKEQARLRKLYAFIDQHYPEKIELQTVADLSHMSKEAFCRYFKKATGSTFLEFLNQYRISQAKRLLMQGQRVSDACYATGFESLSYFNRVFRKIAGENPRDFRKNYA